MKNKDMELSGLNIKQDKKIMAIIYIVFTICALLSIIPFYMMIINSTRSDFEITKGMALIPDVLLKENFIKAESIMPIVRGFFNSIYIAIMSTTLSVYFSTLVAYGFHSYRFKGKNILFVILMISMMLPAQLTIIGYYQMIRSYGLLNSYIPLILPGIASASTVFFLRQYASQALNREIIESARVDGAGEFYTFNRIAIPILSPAMSTMAIFAFVASWNNYLQPLMILSDRNKFTLPLMIRLIESANQRKPALGATYVAISISVVPILIVFVILSRKIIDGLSSGSVKG